MCSNSSNGKFIIVVILVDEKHFGSMRTRGLADDSLFDPEPFPSSRLVGVLGLINAKSLLVVDYEVISDGSNMTVRPMHEHLISLVREVKGHQE